MSEPAAHTQGWQTAEIVFGVPALLALALDFFKPLSIASGPVSTALIAVGIVTMLAGLGCMVYGRRELAEHAQPTDPGRPTTKIVTTGIYRYSRNPLYLAAALLVLGLGLVLNSWWLIILLVVAMVLCHAILVYPEERYLADKLGEDYLQYRREVYRWIGRKRKY